MYRLLFVISFLTIFIFFCSIEVLAQQNPTVDQVLDNYIKALGGKEALEKITSRVSKGTYKITSTSVNVPLEIYAKAPNKILLEISFSKKEKIQRAFDGTIGWARDLNFAETRDITGTELFLIKSKADVKWAINLKSFYPSLIFKEKSFLEMPESNKTKPEKKEVYVLETPKNDVNPAEKFFFDTKTGLLISSHIETEVPVAEKKSVSANGNTYLDYVPGTKIVPIKIYYDNYKDFDGVKIPMITRQIILENSVIIELTSIEQNKPIDDKLFMNPSK